MGLFARAIEQAGIPATSVTSAIDITRLVKPPRAVFLNFPLGHQTGKKFEPGLQRSILKDALNALCTIKEPGTILELPIAGPATTVGKSTSRSKRARMRSRVSECYFNQIGQIGACPGM